MRTGGIDLAAQPAKTGVCVVDWAEMRVVDLAVGADDDRLLGLVRSCGRTGIDAPFGWPAPFVDAVAAWHRDGAWPVDGAGDDFRRGLRYRRTDEVVWQASGRWPLSVSTDLISVAAFRCVSLLSRLDGLDRSGRTGPVAETYPAAALHAWGAAARGYKGADGSKLRASIVDHLLGGLAGLAVEPGDRDLMVRVADALDAFVCALIARACLLGLTTAPGASDEQAALAEGWIHVPNGTLDALA